MINNCCKLLELHVFVISISLSDDNSARSGSFSLSDFFLVLLFCTKWDLFVLIMNWQP